MTDEGQIEFPTEPQKYEDDRIDRNGNGFNKLERAAMLSVSEDCTDAPAIFRYTKKPHSSFVDASHAPVDISAFVEEILEETQTELCANESPLFLPETIGEIKVTQEKEEALLKECEETATAVKRLRETIAEEAAKNSCEKKRYEDMLEDIRNDIDEMQLKGKTESVYVEAWENTRCEQNVIKCNITEEKLKGILRECSVQEKHEHRVTTEIDTFLRENIAHNEKEIVYWQQRYTEDMKKYTSEIERLRNEIETRRGVVKKLKDEFDRKQRFIDSYLAEKEAIRQQKKHEEHIQCSAVKIEAWWRGVMVRRKLGPYRPEEKKKKRAPKSKK